MRRSLSIVVMLSSLARADMTAPAGPLTPLGNRCDAALAAGLEKFEGRSPDIHFQRRQRTLLGTYEWSDMCGVWGNYTFQLEPATGNHPWRWRKLKPKGEDATDDNNRSGSREANGWRATIRTDGAGGEHLNDRFVDALQPALDICLDSAR